MAEDNVHLALFKEDKVDHVADALGRLRDLGISDDDISVISGVPYSDKILGRPMSWTRVPYIGMAGAVVGFAISMFLNWGTPALYPLHVGGQPLFPIPTSIVLIFELTMLGLLLATFLGVFVEMISPTYGPQGYHPKVSDGHIAILFTCPTDLDRKMHTAMTELGAELVHRSEVAKL
jgi:hypothetical protein